MDISIKEAAFPEDQWLVKELFIEYASSLSFELSFQNFEDELSNLPGDYSAPEGVILLLFHDKYPAACVAFRKIDREICEMKRLYVKPEFRGNKFAEKLSLKLIECASEKGYKFMRLDTVPEMKAAINLYKKLGFYEIEPYCFNPIPGAMFMEKILI